MIGRQALERLDNNRGYEPGNVAWRSKSDNLKNRRSWKHTEATIEKFRRAKAAEAKCDWKALREEWETSPFNLRQVAEKYGVSQPRVSQRRGKEGWVKRNR